MYHIQYELPEPPRIIIVAGYAFPLSAMDTGDDKYCWSVRLSSIDFVGSFQRLMMQNVFQKRSEIGIPHHLHQMPHFFTW